MRITTTLVAIIAATVAVGVATATPTQATDADLCYEQQERPIVKVEHRYEKETRERSRETVNDKWGEWSAWTDWPGVGPRDWGDVPSPLEGDHDRRNDRTSITDRDFRYVIVDSREVVVGTETVSVEVPCPTVPPTTEPPVTTVPPTTEPPVTTVPPTTVPDGCPPGEYPQSYDDDAPCGPVDPCVGIDAETGMGTTLWGIQPCGTPVETTPPTVPPTTPSVGTPSLPETGGETWVMAAIAGFLVAAGFGATRLARR